MIQPEVLSVRDAIVYSLGHLRDNGQTYHSDKWQAIASPDDLFEVTDVFLKMVMPKSVNDLIDLTRADMPWSENHFKERIRKVPVGDPLANPGFEYQNWPYYRPSKHNEKFRAEGDGLFSHTYMERFWPDTSLTGTGAMKYNYGDFDDLIQRLKDDPGTRQAFFAIWHPSDQSNSGVRLPCTIGYHFMIRNNKLSISYLIRSCDAFRHFKNDIYMTIRLAQYVRECLMGDERFSKLELGTMSMWIGSLHCFNTESVMINSFIKKHF